MKTKILPLTLEPTLAAQVEREAAAEERDSVQQVRFILRRWYAGTAAGDPTETAREAIPA
jgi:hypothetical protein